MKNLLIITNLLLILSVGNIANASNITEDLVVKDNKSLILNDLDNDKSITFKSPSTLTNSVVFTLPDGDGSANQLLKTDGSGVLSWSTGSTVITDTLTSTATSEALSANMGKTLEGKKADKTSLIYGINTDPYPTPTTLAEAKEQAKAQIEKKRIDTIEATYDAIKRAKDLVDLNNLLIKQLNGDTLTDAELITLSNIKDRMKWYSDTLDEAKTYRDKIDSASTISEATSISDGATFSSTLSDTKPTISTVLNSTYPGGPASKGSVAGGSSITITGTNFSGVKDVTFDEISASKVTRDSSTTLTVITPYHTNTGKVDVIVKQNFGSVTKTKGFEYIGYCINCELLDSCAFDSKYNYASSKPSLSNVNMTLMDVGTAISTIKFVNADNSKLTSCSASPSLPAGLSIAIADNGVDCEITGTPTAGAAKIMYSIKGTNSAGSATVYSVLGFNLLAPSLANASAVVASKGTAISNIDFTNSGGGSLSSCSVSPTLPTGLSVDVSGDNCRISGTPSVTQAQTTFTVTGTNVTGNDTATVNLTVNVSSSGSLTSSTSGTVVTFNTNAALATSKTLSASDFTISNSNATSAPTISSVSYSGSTITINLSRSLKSQTNGSKGAGINESISIAFTKSSSTVNLNNFTAQTVTNSSTAENCTSCTLDNNSCPF